MILLPDSIINKIISYITEETPTSIIIKQYNKDIADDFVCCCCRKEIRNRLFLTCSNTHNNCWNCLKIKIRVYDLNCYKCPFTFQCLRDEIPHI